MPPAGRDVKLVLVIPPCSFCFDRDAAEEVMTVWGWYASLCVDCAGKYRRPDARVRYLAPGAAQPPLVTEAEAGEYVERQHWTRAQPSFRGRPQAAHEYVLLRRSDDPWLQLRVLAFIRAEGQRRRYGKNWHHYWTWGEYEYWAMPPQNAILNRRHLEWPA